jgi:hypothetical protein
MNNVPLRHIAILLAVWTIALTAQLVAQNVTFTAAADPTSVAMGDQIEVQFTLTGSTGGKNFRPPGFNDFVVLSGPNQSTNFQMGTGGTFSSITYSYVLQPRAEGKFTIGPASIEFGGKQLQTNAISISVSKGAAPQSKSPQRGQAGADPNVAQQVGDNLLIRISVDKSKVVQGEQVTATYKIYNRINLVDLKISKNPALTGFWSEELDVPQRIQWTNETLNGKQYRVGLLKKVALFPQRSGILELDPMEAECMIQVQTRRKSNDIFDQFFNDPFFGNVQNVRHVARSQSVRITVAPLPQENIPPGFNGAVGSLSMEAFLDKREIKTNDPVTLKVKIKGAGNLKLINAPEIVTPPDLERYDPRISDNISNQGDRIAGSRTFEYVLIARHPGDLKIASFPFSYYDPDRKAYVALRSPEFSLSVAKGSDVATAAVSGISKEDVLLLGEDIRFIRSGDVSLRRHGEKFFGSAVHIVLVVSPVFAFFGFVLFMRKRERVLGDVVSLRNRKARKVAIGRLSRAQQYLKQEKKEEFYAEVSRALWGYVGDKLGLPPSDLSVDAVRIALQSKHVPEEIVSRFASTIEQCEFARFAPAADAHQRDEFYAEAVALISGIEERVR